MKLVWSPETALKVYIETVKSCKLFTELGVPELVSSMAGGWNTKLIVEAPSCGGAGGGGGSVATSVGLTIAARHTGGRHVCIVPDERSRLEYIKAMQDAGVLWPEIIVGEADKVMAALVGVDFLVADGRRKDLARVLRFANLSHRGAVLVCTNANQITVPGFRWQGVLDSATRVVRSVLLPVGKGLDTAYVGSSGETAPSHEGPRRWIRLIDGKSGEEYLFRR